MLSDATPSPSQLCAPHADLKVSVRHRIEDELGAVSRLENRTMKWKINLVQTQQTSASDWGKTVVWSILWLDHAVPRYPGVSVTQLNWCYWCEEAVHAAVSL